MNLNKFVSRFQNSIYAQSIRHGLTLAIPFLIMGSFALLLGNFPSDNYQIFLKSFLGGGFAELLNTIYNISLGSLALVLSVTISISYGLLVGADSFILYPLVAVCSYLAFCGGIENEDEYIFKSEWVFTAMCITLLSCVLFQNILSLSRHFKKLHTTGAEYLFNLSIQSLLPVVIIIILFALTGALLRLAWGNANITNFGSYIFLKVFDGISGNLFGILLYVILTHVLWFMGIHGTNTLDAVAKKLFEHNIEINQSLMIAGNAPTEIFSKTFLDTFVFLGGCGSALCFVLALWFASTQSHNKKISYVALPSVLFNISEIAVFGFPIIFNFTMLIPFILTPVVLTMTSALAIWIGLVPAVTESVEWTVPILMSGYKATGTFAGSILQLVNLAIGIIIYIPFIRRSELKETVKFKQAVRQMEIDMAAGEKTGNLPHYLNQKYLYNYYAKTLAMDLHNAMNRKQIMLFYQPQISKDGKLHGIEGLVRWEHPVAGYIAPPVIIHLAYESGILNKLSEYLLDKACTDAEYMQNEIKNDVYMAINISPKEMLSENFFDHVSQIISKHQLRNIHPVLEITERAAMEITDYLKEHMEYLKNHGIDFSLDDFGMGHNSVIHLQEGIFNEVKLDGQLVTQLLSNDRSLEIISGIIKMAQNLNCRVVAEFVETKEQRDTLLSLGCVIYQGYYYSRPLPLHDFLEYVQKNKII